MKLYLIENWPDTWREGQRILNRDVKPAFGSRPLPTIKRADVAEFLDTLRDRPAIRKNTHSLLRKLFRWAVHRGDLDLSPIADMEAPKPVPARKRVLSPEEVACVWLAAGTLSYPWGPFVRILITTLQRREEVAAMCWSEVDVPGALWVLPSERAKNDEANDVPLSGLAARELKMLSPRPRGLVFSTTGHTPISGFSKAKRRLDAATLVTMKRRAFERGEDVEAVQMEPWRFHDLRRTGATNMQALGFPVEVTEAILNHVSGTRAGVAGVYNRYRYNKEKCLALNGWSDHLSDLLQNSCLAA